VSLGWGGRFRKGGSKFGNIPTRIDNVTFHSKKEAHRYLQLKAMQEGGLISDLELQPAFNLCVNDVKVCRYIADFRYRDLALDRVVVEDVKGMRTKEYQIKARLMLACLGIEVLET
jgi:hypothetical protein